MNQIEPGDNAATVVRLHMTQAKLMIDGMIIDMQVFCGLLVGQGRVLVIALSPESYEVSIVSC